MKTIVTSYLVIGALLIGTGVNAATLQERIAAAEVKVKLAQCSVDWLKSGGKGTVEKIRFLAGCIGA